MPRVPARQLSQDFEGRPYGGSAAARYSPSQSRSRGRPADERPQSTPRGPPPAEPLVILRRAQVERKTGLPCSSLYSLIAENKFPKPMQLSARRVGWLQHEVQLWLEERVAESRQARPVVRRRRRQTEAV